MRLSGQVQPYIPSSAPLNYRLSNEVYSLDGCSCKGMGDFSDIPKSVFILGGIAAIIWFFNRKGK